MPSGHELSTEHLGGRKRKKEHISYPRDRGPESNRNPKPEKLVNRFFRAGKEVNQTLGRGDDKAQDPSDSSDGEHPEQIHANKDLQRDGRDSNLCAVTGSLVE